MKPIIFTKHAESRLEERGITKEQVEEVIEKGKIITWRNNLPGKEYKDIKAIYKEKEDIISVVTIYRVIKSLEDNIDKIPYPHEWWKTENRDVFITQAYYLKDKGLSEEDIIKRLTILYLAVCGEFGE